VRFMQSYGKQAIPLMTVGAVAGPAGFTVTAPTVIWPGAAPDMVKRTGLNTYDRFQANVLQIDFDNGAEANNAIPGSNTAVANEAFIGHGDSGGPQFFWSTARNRYEIVGVTSNFTSELGPPDARPYVRGTDYFTSNSPDSSFGEIGDTTAITRN